MQIFKHVAVQSINVLWKCGCKWPQVHFSDRSAGHCGKQHSHIMLWLYWHTAYYKNILSVPLHVCSSDVCVGNDCKAGVCVCVLPVRTVLAEGSARSRADLPSVFLMFGSAPCWSNTVRNRSKQYSHRYWNWPIPKVISCGW